MKSSVAKHSVVLAGHKTSISLEDEFWRALKDIASSRRITPWILSTVSTPTASMVISRRPHGCSYSITIRQEQRHILATADRGLSSRMRRTKPITLDICCAVLQRSDLFGLYISPMAPLFPPEFATASSISGIQIARAMTVISPSSYHHRWKCRLNMRIHCSLPVGLACRQARMSL